MKNIHTGGCRQGIEGITSRAYKPLIRVKDAISEAHHLYYRNYDL